MQTLKKDSPEHGYSFFRADISSEKSPQNQGKLCQHWKMLNFKISNLGFFQCRQSLPWFDGLFSGLKSALKKAISELKLDFSDNHGKWVPTKVPFRLQKLPLVSCFAPFLLILCELKMIRENIYKKSSFLRQLWRHKMLTIIVLKTLWLQCSSHNHIMVSYLAVVSS